MFNKPYKSIFLVALLSSVLFAEIDIQKNIYDAAEEMIRFDEKLNQAIRAHNQLDGKDEDETYLKSMTINDFTETPTGYILEQKIENHTETELKVEIKEGLLIISTKMLDKDFFSHEFNNTEITTISSMSVSIFIPNNADEDQMQEKYENGLLTINLPRKNKNNH